MGLILTAIYPKGDSIISEVSVKFPSKNDVEILEDSKNKWDEMHPFSKNTTVKSEGTVTTIFTEFNKDESDIASLFQIFVNAMLLGEPQEGKMGEKNEN
jgi:hypothetical protein